MKSKISRPFRGHDVSLNFSQFPVAITPYIGTDVVVGYQMRGSFPTLARYTIAQLAVAVGPFVVPGGGGPTSNRPVAPSLYSSYFDTTLGQPIWAEQVTPTVIWVNAAGVSV